MKRSELKAIIKECLVEILAEGIGQEALVEAKKATPRRASSHRADLKEQLRSRRSKRVAESDPAENPEFDNKVNNFVNSMTTDPVLAEIFADTAKTTMQEQPQAD